MPYIIDGHNLIGKLSSIDLQDIDDEIQLINILEKYFRKIRKKAFLFFDRGNLHQNNNFSYAFLQVKFVKPPITADEAIIQKLEQMKGNARNYTVISSDNWVSQRSQRMGAKTLTSDDFALMILNSNNTPGSNPKNQDANVDYWLKIFDANS